MPNMRIYELAKKLNKTNRDIISFLEKIGVTGKTHSSSLDHDTAEKVLSSFTKPSEAKKKPEAAPKKAAQRPVEEAKKTAPAEKISEKKTFAAPPKAELSKAAVEIPKPEAAKQSAQKQFKKQLPKLPAMKEPLKAPIPPPVIEAEPVKSELPDEREEVLKVAPGMQKAFQAIRKIEHAKRRVPIGVKRPLKDKAYLRSEKYTSAITAPRKKTLALHEGITVKEFSEMIGVKVPDVIKKFMELGYMPSINQALDLDAAVLVAEGLGVKLEIAHDEDISAGKDGFKEDASALKERPPIVTIMGHVDHGKTSLLDAIRKTKVIETEAGGITQHIGAYMVTLKGKNIVFLDTPGHEAFTALRARGAKVTDIVILVVAADDGVKPQTIEAIDHAKAANVPIIVAINKIDKPDANPQRVKIDLSEREIVTEEWGGKNIFAEISAKQRIGIENLLELILLQSEMMELKANPDRPAKGVIIESKLDKGRGPVATVIVQSGTLKIGDAFFSGTSFGKVRGLADDMGKKIKNAGPSMPVEIVGFNTVPSPGEPFAIVEDEKKARQIVAARQQKQRVAVGAKQKLTLDELYLKIKEGKIKDLNIIIKGDVQGSVEALKDSLEGITHPEVKVRVIHSAVGGINESDVMLASASNAIIIGFNVRPDVKASSISEKEGVDIELYNIIYEAIEDVKKALEGMLEPTIKEKILGKAEVRQTFQVSRIGTIAGCYVLDGTINRASDGVRIIRDNIVIYTGKISTLKRFKDDAKEVQAGYECGITIENYNDIKVGDVLENFILEKIAGKL